MPRLDVILVARQLVPTRSRASDLIRRGFVSVDGVAVTKPGADIAESAVVRLADATPSYVSRGAEKLVAGLDHFHFDVAGVHAVDIGASTGGFTQVLLARGAHHVTAVDVGQGQLHPSLRTDPRVTVRESTDARHLTPDHFTRPVAALVSDVSFISLEKALPVVMQLAEPGAWLIALIKPQFEVGPALVGKGGLVRNEEARAAAVQRLVDWFERTGWPVEGVIPSPIKGGDGNQEYLIGARKKPL